jgi:hypothetical protein
VTDLHAKVPVKRVVLEAVVIRADGTREDLGVVSDSSWVWRFGPGRLLAAWRTRKANQHG